MADRRAMVSYVWWRTVHGAFVVLGAILISFMLTSISGDAAQARLGLFASGAQLRRMRVTMGLNKPLVERFVTYVAHAATGNFGSSFSLQKPALGIVLHALPWTVGLVGAAITLGLALAVPGAVVSVVRTGTPEDAVVQSSFAVLQGLPEFWLALLTTLWFSAELGWLPALGASGVKAWVLPVVAIALPLTPTLFRMLRGELLDVMSMDFMQGLAGKGLSPTEIVVRHGLRNTAGPFVNLLCLQVGWLVGGTLVVETIFSWPGIGDLLYISVQQRDYPVIEAVVVVIAATYALLNLTADIVVVSLDPRVRLARVQSQ